MSRGWLFSLRLKLFGDTVGDNNCLRVYVCVSVNACIIIHNSFSININIELMEFNY